MVRNQKSTTSCWRAQVGRKAVGDQSATKIECSDAVGNVCIDREREDNRKANYYSPGDEPFFAHVELSDRFNNKSQIVCESKVCKSAA